MTALELIVNYPCRLGENPLWHPLEKKVYWVDILEGAIHRYDPQTNAHEIVHRGDVTGGFTIQADGSLLLFSAKAAIRRLRDGVLTTLHESLPGEEVNRFNDVIADPKGRVFCGTMPYTDKDKKGSLYRLDLDGSYTKVVDNIGTSNGMAFTADLKTFYHTDSPTHTIYAYDYDVESGSISNRRDFIILPEANGSPDGMTIDADGFIWSANWNGYRLARYDAQGNYLDEIKFPVKKVTSLIFGGDDLSDIYVTSAGGDTKDENGETAGSLYRLRTGVKGRAEYFSRVGM